MAVFVESIEETYCEHCHLATPLWKRQCIHCGTRFGADLEEAKIAKTDWGRLPR